MPPIDDYKKEEKIQGVIYNMSPSAGFDHATVNGNIYASFHQQLKNSLCKIFIENADLYMDSSDKEYVIPDIMIVCDTKEFKKNSRKYYGIPKFVAETLSPSTAKKDKSVKKDLYARKGIPEYWIIDYRSKSVDIHYLNNGIYELDNSYMLQEIPEEEEYNANEIITLRELPIQITLEDIFDGLED